MRVTWSIDVELDASEAVEYAVRKAGEAALERMKLEDRDNLFTVYDDVTDTEWFVFIKDSGLIGVNPKPTDQAYGGNN